MLRRMKMKVKFPQMKVRAPPGSPGNKPNNIKSKAAPWNSFLPPPPPMPGAGLGPRKVNFYPEKVSQQMDNSIGTFSPLLVNCSFSHEIVFTFCRCYIYISENSLNKK